LEIASVFWAASAASRSSCVGGGGSFTSVSRATARGRRAATLCASATSNASRGRSIPPAGRAATAGARAIVAENAALPMLAAVAPRAEGGAPAGVGAGAAMGAARSASCWTSGSIRWAPMIAMRAAPVKPVRAAFRARARRRRRFAALSSG
jgi:hypothetical protein